MGVEMFLYFLAIFALIAVTSATILFFRRKNSFSSGIIRIVIGNVFIVLIVLLACFVVMESYYRFVYDTTDSFGFTLVAKRWMERHFNQKNNFGFRDTVDYRYIPEESKERITFLGDSFAAGHGVDDVDERFANVIRKEKPEWEVHCVAVPGASTIAEVTMLQRLLSDGYRAETVVLVFCLNDAVENSDEWKTRCALLQKKYDSDSYLLNNSYFLNTLYFRLKRINDPLVKDYFGDLEKYYRGPDWDVERKALQRLRGMVRRHGGKLLVVVFSFLHTIGDSYPFHNIQEKMASFFRDHGIPCLDLLRTYSEYQSSELVVNKYDSHPNVFAHGLAAEQIIEFIERESAGD